MLWPNAATIYWTTDVFAVKRVGGVASVGNQSLNGVLHRWPFPSSGQVGVWLAISLVTVVMGLYVAQRCLAEGRRVAAMLSLAVVGVLISPISWTHHWVWVALIPPVLLKVPREVTRRSVRVMLWLVFSVSVLAPYWWFASGAAQHYLGDSLTLLAFVLLALWSAVEFVGQSTTTTESIPLRIN